jgi:hypothetical protein
MSQWLSIKYLFEPCLCDPATTAHCKLTFADLVKIVLYTDTNVRGCFSLCRFTHFGKNVSNNLEQREYYSEKISFKQ